MVSTREPLQVSDFADVVYIADSEAEFLEQCRKAATEKSPDKVERRLAYGKACSWSERVRQMERTLYEKKILGER